MWFFLFFCDPTGIYLTTQKKQWQLEVVPQTQFLSPSSSFQPLFKVFKSHNGINLFLCNRVLVENCRISETGIDAIFFMLKLNVFVLNLKKTIVHRDFCSLALQVSKKYFKEIELKVNFLYINAHLKITLFFCVLRKNLSQSL